jgi:hypothetical protein
MNPSPFFALNHFTVPATALLRFTRRSRPGQPPLSARDRCQKGDTGCEGSGALRPKCYGTFDKHPAPGKRGLTGDFRSPRFPCANPGPPVRSLTVAMAARRGAARVRPAPARSVSRAADATDRRWFSTSSGIGQSATGTAKRTLVRIPERDLSRSSRAKPYGAGREGLRAETRLLGLCGSGGSASTDRAGGRSPLPLRRSGRLSRWRRTT